MYNKVLVTTGLKLGAMKNISTDQGDEMSLSQGCQMVYFRNKNHNLGKILEGLVMENVVIFYDHLFLRPFGMFYVNLV
jgi:hypothetical protein